MHRRQLIAAIGTSTGIALAGCSGNSSGGEDTEAAFELITEENQIIATFDEDQAIESFQILGADGGSIGSETVEGAETRLTLFSNGLTGIADYTQYVNETLEIVAIDENQEEIDTIEFAYSPEIEINDITADTEATEFDINVDNSIEWPITVFAEFIFNEEASKEISQAEIVETQRDETLDERPEEINSISFSRNSQEYVVNNGGVSDETGDLVSGNAEDSTVSVSYVNAGGAESGLGDYEYNPFDTTRAEEVADVDEQVTLPAELTIVLSDNIEKQYDIELLIDGFQTAVQDLGGDITYRPKEITLETIEER